MLEFLSLEKMHMWQFWASIQTLEKNDLGAFAPFLLLVFWRNEINKKSANINKQNVIKFDVCILK